MIETTSSVLAHADELHRGGETDRAIQLLTESNRERRHVAIERRLVVLRHEAFAEIPRVDVRELPPPVTAVEHPRPRRDLRPEELDLGSLRSGLAEHGFVVVRGLIPRDRADALARGIDRALDAYDAYAAGNATEADGPWYTPFQPTSDRYELGLGVRSHWVRPSGGVWTADSPRNLFELIELIDGLGICSVIAQHLGERPALSLNKCTLRRVPVDARSSWHQDGAFLGQGARSLDLWLALSPCGVDSPGLELVPRRIDEVLPTGAEGAIFDWSVGEPLVARVAKDFPPERPVFEPGDAVLLDHLCLHRTAIEGHMRRERHAIETWFFGPSAYPDGQIPIVL